MLALTAIFKDDTEIELAKRMLKSFSPYVDGIFVALTGTSGKFNKLKRLLDSYKAKYVICSPQTHPKLYTKEEDHYFFSNFAEARNISWSIVTENFKYVMWADIDDVIIAGEEIKQAVKRMEEKNLDAIFFNYWYSVKLKGDEITDVVIEHYRERIMKRGVYKWVSRLHEVCLPIDSNYQPKYETWVEGQEGKKCVWVHLTEDTRINKALERNEKILKIQANEEKFEDPRTLFYLAKLLFDKKTPESLNEAIPLLELYLYKSGWDAERANACEYLGLIYQLQGKYREAVKIFHRGVMEYPKHHLLYLRLASAYYDIEQNEFGDHWLDLAMKFDLPKATATIQHTEEIKLLACTLKYIQARRHNDLKGMLEWANRRAGLMGQDDGVLSEVKQLDELNTVAQGTFNLAKYLESHGQKDKIINLVSLLPREIGQLPAISFLATRSGYVKKWSDKSVVYYASFGAPHFEQWGPDSADKGGIGGSETAVIRLSEEWAKKGYEVTVYADIKEEVTTKNGVHWLPFYAVNWNDEFNTLILWRSPHLVDVVKKAKKLYYDAHDIESQLNWPEDRMNKIDKVFFKSDWHRSNLPKLHDNKCVVISNGIKYENL